MQLDVYVNYRGTCEEAFRFYEQHLGGRALSIQRHETLPPSPNIPPEWRSKVLHGRIEIAGTVLMGADVPSAEPVRSAYLSLRVDSADEAERIYALLAEGGEIFMKMEENFFATRFAMLRDRFGTSWMLMHQRATE